MELSFTVDRFENNKAVLSFDSDQNIIVEKNKLPSDTKEGDVLVFNIKKNNDKTEEQKKLAKEIINEILNTGEENE